MTFTCILNIFIASASDFRFRVALRSYYSSYYQKSQIMTSEEPPLTDLTPATLADTLKKIDQGEKTADQMERILNQMEDKIELLLKDLSALESDNKDLIGVTDDRNLDNDDK